MPAAIPRFMYRIRVRDDGSVVVDVWYGRKKFEQRAPRRACEVELPADYGDSDREFLCAVMDRLMRKVRAVVPVGAVVRCESDEGVSREEDGAEEAGDWI